MGRRLKGKRGEGNEHPVFCRQALRCYFEFILQQLLLIVCILETLPEASFDFSVTHEYSVWSIALGCDECIVSFSGEMGCVA